MSCDESYDAIVVGSGYGGAVAACRMSLAGIKVCLIEKGKRWEPKDFPRDVFSLISAVRMEWRKWGISIGSDKTLFQRGVYRSEKEAYETYCEYAHNVGLSVRKEHHSYWPNSRSIKLKDFVCSKVGQKKGIDLNCQTKYRKSNTRMGCPAMIIFAVSQDGVWTVQKSIESHNHVLARRADQHLLRSCRNISDEKALILKSMIEAGI
ncbi:hypothetical protein M5K25_006905 [Dendrobium thyrsiflorum]|uniref:Protein FAR1-RELATED SEQUENCE n=1 Tax=Dendrobium thyrsiflorum TaxID=117978 RepID=A0ABD0VCF1_DENTH